MNELFETVAKIVEDNAEFHVFKLRYVKNWTCVIERKDGGVELKVHGEGFDCPEAIGDACDKWLRITKNVKEFSAPDIEHVRPVPEPEPFDDSIPF